MSTWITVNRLIARECVNFELLVPGKLVYQAHIYCRSKYAFFGKYNENNRTLTFWFAGNGWTPTVNKKWDSYATLVCSFMDEKFRLQCPILKTLNDIYRNLSFFNTSPKCLITFNVSFITLWIYRTFLFSNLLQASYYICDRSQDNNVSDKTKWQKGVTQGTVSFHLVSYRKSA